MKWNLLGAFLTLPWSTQALALELASVTTPAATASIAPRLTLDHEQRALLSWIEKSESGHQLRFARLEGDHFGRAQTVIEHERLFVNWADTPGLRVLPNGRYLAHWLQRSGQGTFAYDVMVSISDDQGLNWSQPAAPHDDGTLTEHGFVSTFSAGPDQLGLVWLDGRETQPAPVDGGHQHHGTGAMTLRTAQLNASGEFVRSALLDARVCDCCGTAAARTNSGVVIAYRDRSENEIRDIRLIRQTDRGWSQPVSVHADGWRIDGCPVNGPALLARGEEVLVAWFTMAQDVPVVRLARSGDGGRHFKLVQEFDAGSAIGRVDLSWTQSGYLLSWMQQTGEGAQLRLAHRAGATGSGGVDRLLALDGGRSSGFPKILGLADGRVLLAWTGQHALTGEGQVQTALLTLTNTQESTADTATPSAR